jgi:hypothetical protein
MCGDTNCPSCGPAQGYNPAFETVCEWAENVLLADVPEAINVSWLAEDLMSRIGRMMPQEVVDAFEVKAREWARNGYK